jgi:hypothetical protein
MIWIAAAGFSRMRLPVARDAQLSQREQRRIPLVSSESRSCEIRMQQVEQYESASCGNKPEMKSMDG